MIATNDTRSLRSESLNTQPAQGIAYPLPAYIASWKIFRSFSNEDRTIASHVISQLNGLHRPVDLDGRRDWSIVDIGPGDGRVLIELLLHLAEPPKLLSVVEPNSEFMEQTKLSISFYSFAKAIDYHTCRLADVADAVIESAEVILCTHSAYFLTHEEMDKLLAAMQRGARLYVVMDAADSLFSRTWKQTAPSYFERAERHRTRLQSLHGQGFSVRQSAFDTLVKSPFEMREDIGEMLMSLICYCDIRDLPLEELGPIQHQIRSSVSNGYITCQSSCFEVTKT